MHVDARLDGSYNPTSQHAMNIMTVDLRQHEKNHEKVSSTFLLVRMLLPLFDHILLCL